MSPTPAPSAPAPMPYSPVRQSGSGNKAILIVSSVLGTLVVLCGIILLVLWLVGKHGQDSGKADIVITGDPSVQKIHVSDIQTLSNITFYGYYDYSADRINDDNTASCWSVNLNTARSQGRFNGNVLQGLIFTLGQSHIGSMVLLGGYCKDSRLYYDNAAPTQVTLTDLASGRVIGAYNVADIFCQPLITLVNADLKPCSDGQYRVQVDFGSATVPGVRPGSRYHDFCVSELSFWPTNKVNPAWPVGDRAMYDLRGPVKSVTTRSGGNVLQTVEFDGAGRTGTYYKASYTTAATTVTCSRQGYYYTNVYNPSGVLVSSANQSTGMRSRYTYDYANRLVREDGNGSGGAYYEIYTYDGAGQRASGVFGGWAGVSTVRYTVISTDSYGNWTKRKETGLSNKEVEREIIYYR